MSSVSKTLQNYRITSNALRQIKDLLESKLRTHIEQLKHFVEDGNEVYVETYGYGYDSDELWRALSQGNAEIDIQLTELVQDDLTITNPEWPEEKKLQIVDGSYDRASYNLNSPAGGTSSITIQASSYGWGSVNIYSRDPLWGESVTMEEVLALLEPCRISPEEALEQAPRLPFRVFIGHGNDQDWRILRDDLRDKHSFEIEAFEGRPRIGQTIKDVLLDMASYSTAAVVVLTRADRTDAGEFRGRQNVVHELGLFQGLLGWEKVIIVMEEGVALPTNLDGTQQVRYPSGYIQTAVGETVAALNALKEQHEQEGHHP